MSQEQTHPSELDILLTVIEADTERFLNDDPIYQGQYLDEVGHVLRGRKMSVPTSEGPFVITGEIKDNKNFCDFTIQGNGTAVRYQKGKEKQDIFNIADLNGYQLFGDEVTRNGHAVDMSMGLSGAIKSLPREHVQALVALQQSSEYVDAAKKWQRKQQGVASRIGNLLSRH